MMDWSPNILQNQYNALADTTQIIFAHPQYYHQNRVVHFLIEQGNSAYIRFEGHDLNTSDLQSQVSNYLESHLSDNIDLFILDECDRAGQSDFNQFLQQFATHQTSKRIAVISRMVAHELLEDVEFRKRCQFLPVDEDLMLYDYALRDQSVILIEVRGFGSGRVHVNGRPIDSWDGILPRRLFFYLADRGMVTRNDIFDTFWPDLKTREATNVFHVTKRKITDILGTSFTKFGSGFYRIAPEIKLTYDVIHFSEFIQNSVISTDRKAMSLLEKAITLYRAPYLNSESSEDAPWVEKRRDELHEMYGEALSILANHKLDAGYEDQALGYYLNALKILNHREELVEKVMQIYHKRGQLLDALEIYDWIKHNLDIDFGIEPSATLQKLAKTINQELPTTL